MKVCIMYTLCHILQIPDSEEETIGRPGPRGLAQDKVRFCHSILLQSNFNVPILQIVAEPPVVMKAFLVTDCTYFLPVTDSDSDSDS